MLVAARSPRSARRTATGAASAAKNRERSDRASRDRPPRRSRSRSSGRGRCRYGPPRRARRRAPRLLERRVGTRRHVRRQRPSSGNARGTRTTVIASTARRAPLRARPRSRPSPRRCRRASSGRGCAGTRRPAGARSSGIDLLEQARLRGPPHGDEDDEADGEPRRARRSARRDASPSRAPRRRRSAARRREQESGAGLRVSGRSGERGTDARSRAPARSRMTASCAAVNAMRTPNEYRLGQNAGSPSPSAVATTSAIASAPRCEIASLETSVRRSRRANSRGSMPCPAERVASRVIPETEVVAAANRISAPESPTTTRSTSTSSAGSSPSNAAVIPTSGASSHSRRARSASGAGIGRQTDDGDQHGDDRRPARSPRTASAAASAPARAPPRRGWRPSRGRCRRALPSGSAKSEVVPVLPGAKRETVGKRLGREAGARARARRGAPARRDRGGRRASAAAVQPAFAGRAGRPRSTAITTTADDDVPRLSRSSGTDSAAPR